MAKKISVILLTLFVVFAVIGCKEDTPKAVAVTGVTLDETSIILDQGESKTLTATVAPNNATNKVVTWTSSDPSKVTVTEGIVTAVVGPATATITVTTEDGSKTAVCIVTVNDPSLPTLSGSVNISPSNATVGTELTATYSGNEDVTLTYQWKKDGSVVGTNSNKYTPTEVGNYTVTVSVPGYNPLPPSPAVTVTEVPFFFELGDFSDGTKSWYTNGVDNVTNTFTEEILKSAKYLIVKAHVDSLNGIGGLQIQIQGTGTNWVIGETDTDSWNNLQALGEYGSSMDFYIVIQLSTLNKWSDLISSDNAKIILSWPVGWTASGDNSFNFVKGILTNVTLEKPSTKVADVKKGDNIYGWFAASVPELH